MSDVPNPDLITALEQLLASMPDPLSTANTDQFEHLLTRCFGVDHAIAVSSGTAALHCALVACGIGPGDEVLVPAMSVVMSVAPVIHAGARPVFVDCSADGTDYDYDDLTAKLTDRTRAVIPVYLWGRAGDPQRLTQLAAMRGLHVIEDACQAHGTRFAGRLLGTFGDLGCFSLKDGKILWSGEGGFILTNNDELAARCRAFRSHWQIPPPNEPPMARLGHNYRLAEPLAVIACANLARFDELLARRQDQTRRLTCLLAGTPGIRVLEPGMGEDWNGYAPLARLDLPRPRAFCEHLAALGVPNSVGSFHLIACDRRPPFAAFAPTPCATAARLIDRTLAVVVADGPVHQYAQTITREARQWISA